MADTPAPARPSSGGGTGARLGHKVGPLPVWAWAVIALVAGYLLYKHFSGSSSAATGTTPAGVSGETPIPLGDQSGAGVGATSGASGTSTPIGAPPEKTPTPGGIGSNYGVANNVDSNVSSQLLTQYRNTTGAGGYSTGTTLGYPSTTIDTIKVTGGRLTQ